MTGLSEGFEPDNLQEEIGAIASGEKDTTEDVLSQITDLSPLELEGSYLGIAHMIGMYKGQKVLVKFFDPKINGLCSDHFKASFKLIKDLHPQIQEVIYYNESEGKAVYRWMEGVTFNKWLETLDEEDLLPALKDFILKMSELLTVLIEKGLVHRDIKPENIIVDTREEIMKVSIIDCDLIQKLSTAENEELKKMADEYMPPETRVNRNYIHESYDIFSLAEMIRKVLEKKGYKWGDEIWNEKENAGLYNFLVKALSIDTSKRPVANEEVNALLSSEEIFELHPSLIIQKEMKKSAIDAFLTIALAASQPEPVRTQPLTLAA
jgi:serine/threonine protein kinase